jgi:hypothetical protein
MTDTIFTALLLMMATIDVLVYRRLLQRLEALERTVEEHANSIPPYLIVHRNGDCHLGGHIEEALSHEQK